MRIKDASMIKHEAEIVWVTPAGRELPFVRERYALGWFGPRDVPRVLDPNVLVAYARPLFRNSRRTCNYRRVWVSRPDDVKRYCDPDGFVRSCPIEGVDPKLIEPGKVSADAYAALQAVPVKPTLYFLPQPNPVRRARIRRQHG